MRLTALVFVVVLAACGSRVQPTPAMSPFAPRTVQPQMLHAPVLGRQRCLEAIANVVRKEEDTRFGDVVVRDVFGLPVPQKEAPTWWLITTKAAWCRAVVFKGHMFLPDGSLYHMWVFSRPIATSDATRKRLVDLFKCVEKTIMENREPSPACGIQAEQGVGQ